MKVGHQVVTPFPKAIQRDIATHVREVRRLFDWPGIPYHDEASGFNRWAWHNLPMLTLLHRDPALAAQASRWAGEPVRPSYVFLSMYGPDGVCPPHTDRPQCAWTLDYLIRSDAKQRRWPLYIDGAPVGLSPGEAVFYSGTHQKHHRKYMHEDSDATYCDLAFFHFVPASWQGARD